MFSIRDIDSYVETVAGELALQVTTDTVEHLKFVLLLPDSFTRSKIDGGVDHLRIVRGDAVVNTASQQQLHHLNVVCVDVFFIWKSNFG